MIYLFLFIAIVIAFTAEISLAIILNRIYTDQYNIKDPLKLKKLSCIISILVFIFLLLQIF